jgi:POT family proton-dependent oligopeptide transporter
LAPLIGLLWIWLNNRKIEPNTLIKFGLGFIFLGLGYYLLFATKFFATLQGITSLNVFTIALLVITFGELCLSPIGLSIMTKLSTEKLQGMMMGMWFWLLLMDNMLQVLLALILPLQKLVLLITTL